MKRTIGTNNDMTLTVRTETGRVSIEIGLNEFSVKERRFLFDSIRSVQKQGQVTFSLTNVENGVRELTLRLADTCVEGAVQAALQ